jgi:hypothetical protein
VVYCQIFKKFKEFDKKEMDGSDMGAFIDYEVSRLKSPTLINCWFVIFKFDIYIYFLSVKLVWKLVVFCLTNKPFLN